MSPSLGATAQQCYEAGSSFPHHWGHKASRLRLATRRTRHWPGTSWHSATLAEWLSCCTSNFHPHVLNLILHHVIYIWSTYHYIVNLTVCVPVLYKPSNWWWWSGSAKQRGNNFCNWVCFARNISDVKMSMHSYIYIWLYMYTYIHMCIYIYTYQYIHISTQTIHVHIHVHILLYTYNYTHKQWVHHQHQSRLPLSVYTATLLSRWKILRLLSLAEWSVRPRACGPWVWKWSIHPAEARPAPGRKLFRLASLVGEQPHNR